MPSPPESLVGTTLCGIPLNLQRIPPSPTPAPVGDVRQLLINLRDRQEQSFRRVFEQQQELNNEMQAMTLALKGTMDSQAYVHPHHEGNTDDCREPLLEHSVWEFPATGDSVANGTADALKNSAAAGSATLLEMSCRGPDEATAEIIKFQPKLCSSTSGCQSSSQSSAWSHGLKQTLHVSRQSDLADAATGSVHALFRKWLSRKEFEFVIQTAILMNAFVMCLELQYQGLKVGFNLQYPGHSQDAREVWPGASSAFNIFDWFFGCLFFLEMTLKLVCWGSKYFFEWQDVKTSTYFSASEGQLVHVPRSRLWQCVCSLQYWNLLDFSCVVGFVITKVATAGVVNLQLFRLLRLFCLGRLVKLLRFLESLDQLYIMTTAISALTHVLTWAIVLLTMMLLTCDLILVQILHLTYFADVNASDLSAEQFQKHHEMYKYFGTWSRCMLSMFEFTVGDWQDIAWLLTEEVSEWFILPCLAHKLTIGFAVIGVINGVILQETFKVAQTDDLIMYRQNNAAKALLRKKLGALFDDLDDSGDGHLEIDEIQKNFGRSEIRTWLGSLGVETDSFSLKTLFAMLDKDGDGHITLDEMITRFPPLLGTARSLDVLAMQNYLQEIIEQRGPQGAKQQQGVNGGPSH